MASASFEYWFEVEKWLDGIQEIAIAEPPIDTLRTEIIPCDGEETRREIPVRLELFLSGVLSYEEARRAADEFAEKVLVAAAFTGDLPIHHLYFGHGVYDGQIAEGRGRGGGHSNIVTVRVGDRRTVPQLATGLETHLRRISGPAGNYYEMFRAAMQAYGIGRYLLLYLILMTRFSDDQRKVDAFIQQEEPGVLVTQRPDKPKKSETTYTRLRNEVNHSRLGVSQTTTREEMDQMTPGLVSLVKIMMGSL